VLLNASDEPELFNWINPMEERQRVTDRPAGEGFRHWQVSYDMTCHSLNPTSPRTF
jgi:hypothetical protein